MRAVVMVAVVIRSNLIKFMLGGITCGVGSGAGVTICFLCFISCLPPPPPPPTPTQS